jgi:hypothetical protein
MSKLSPDFAVPVLLAAHGYRKRDGTATILPYEQQHRVILDGNPA